ncbi:hypothetical protein ACFQ0X_43785 [Streptomyces rectiviolaceus]|uniref:Transposase n=1 Tax=Streptomyces rectiviolaceus TaxID=332591 RepID=A0ABP6NPC5_9ACTN
MTGREGELPHEVTFASGARLLVERGIDPHATADSVRHIARSRKNWPFGEGREHPYSRVANARTMNAKVFLRYFEDHPPNPRGRGRDKQPRAKKTT